MTFLHISVMPTLVCLLAALLEVLLFHDKKLFSFIASYFTSLNSS